MGNELILRAYKTYSKLIQECIEAIDSGKVQLYSKEEFNRLESFEQFSFFIENVFLQNFLLYAKKEMRLEKLNKLMK